MQILKTNLILQKKKNINNLLIIVENKIKYYMVKKFSKTVYF